MIIRFPANFILTSPATSNNMSRLELVLLLLAAIVGLVQAVLTLTP